MTQDLKTKAYERGIQAHLKSIAESGSDVHQNHTPSEICDMMLDKLDLSQPKSMLVLYNIELLFALKKRKFSGHVTFFTQSQEKADLAPKIFSNLTVEYIDKEENPLYHMETKWPEKFDIVIANPPYSKKLDLKFLDKAFDVANEEVVFVHPSTSFVDTKGKNQMFQSINSKIEKYISSLTFFNGNAIFGISLYVPCSITHIIKDEEKKNFQLFKKYKNKTYLCNSIEEISVFGNIKEFWSFYKKTEKNANLHTNGNILGSRQEHKRLLKKKLFFVETSHIAGNQNKGVNAIMDSNQHKNDFFVIINKQHLDIKFNQNPVSNIFWEFETETEAKNFINYCKTDFARACLAKTKINQHLYNGELKSIPWMDFNQEWTDEKLYAHFNITEEEQAFIKEVIPPYYD